MSERAYLKATYVPCQTCKAPAVSVCEPGDVYVTLLSEDGMVRASLHWPDCPEILNWDGGTWTI